MSSYKPRRQIIAELKEKQIRFEEWQEKTEYYKQTAKKIKAIIIHNYQEFKTRLGFSLVNLKGGYKHIKELKKLFHVCNKNCFALLKKVGRIIFHFLNRLGNVINNFLTPFGKMKWYLLFMFYLYVLGLNIYSMLDQTNNNQLQNQFQQINHYPLLPTSYFTTAKTLFDFGYESLAWEYFNKGESLLKTYHAIYLDKLILTEYQQSKQYLNAVQIKRQYLKQIDEILEKKAPFSLELLLTKAKIEAELYNKNQARKAIQLAYWLNPQLEKFYKEVLAN